MQNDNELDQIVDAALSDYLAEPRLGIEQHVLARVRYSHRRVVRLRWCTAVGAAACLLVVALTFTRTAPKRNNVARILPKAASGISAQTRQTRSHAVSETSAKPTDRRRARAIARVAPEPLPKLELFPVATQLTEDEKTLLMFAERATDEERDELLSVLQRTTEPTKIEPIQIGAIKVLPLRTDGN